jgi:hypothetical protein
MLKTRVAEFGIACEACHGPGERHVTLQRDLLRATPGLVHEEADPIVNPRKLDRRDNRSVTIKE